MKEIIVVGLGPGSLEQLSFGVWQTLNTGEKIYFRTGRHPVVQELAEQGISFSTFDHVYEVKESFKEVYEEIAQSLIGSLNADTSSEQLIYGVPGHPLIGEDSVRLLLEKGPLNGIKITIKPSMSFIDALYGITGLNPAIGYRVHDALSVELGDINPVEQLIFFQVYNRMVASDLKLMLLEAYPYDHPVIVIRGAGIPNEERIARVELYKLDHIDWFDHLTSVYLEPLEDKSKYSVARYSLDPLIEVMEKLLSPEGCPWDLQQDHFTLKPCILEEAYEVIEAIDSKDMYKLREELGDLLLQIVFHSALAEKRGDFSSNDVVETITKKMIRRHPHVFADTIVRDSDEVLVNWERIKAEERGNGLSETTEERVMDRLNKTLPALMLAEEVQKKAKKVGFDWPNADGAWDKLFEEIAELKEACQERKNIEDELGDLIFAVVNIARFVKVSPEAALMKTVRKFIGRFNYIEQNIAKNGIKWEQMDLASLDILWEKAKKAGL